MADMTSFLEQSPIASRTKLNGTVVLQRSSITPATLLAIKEHGKFKPGRLDTKSCDLEVGGVVLARGRIVRRRGRSYLRITEVVSGNDAERGGTS